MTKDELLKLADRCEREEPSQELDAAISRAFLASGLGNGAPCYQDYTHSLDAAVTLVPSKSPRGAEVGWQVTSLEASVFWVPTRENNFDGCASTPALALCAAALRARASLTEKG